MCHARTCFSMWPYVYHCKNCKMQEIYYIVYCLILKMNDSDKQQFMIS